jgi:hypothetical protein
MPQSSHRKGGRKEAQSEHHQAVPKQPVAAMTTSPATPRRHSVAAHFRIGHNYSYRMVGGRSTRRTTPYTRCRSDAKTGPCSHQEAQNNGTCEEHAIRQCIHLHKISCGFLVFFLVPELESVEHGAS